ncbi:oligosaccharyl transferase glycoprotein complex, beta subunit [Rachicladosporium monterosium]|uniref:Dolichyl-diphosphooligosaccharide--protein glycosyltransferase subunit WBP1 n=1 Tax=Rachicladosporium monterosium TaxID=1507873 RepID=A0ABR0L771_9PEZI|nr:oligosaccharyl transferase glycoprotein complex, beta subunit [Rachicladosporium monterosium]
MRLRLFGLALGLLGFVSALSAQGQNLLVVIEDESDKTKYSQFWSDLQDRGFQLSYRSPKDTTLSLFLHGEPAYSHLLLLPTKSKGFGPNLTPNLIVDFVNGGSNVLLASATSKKAIKNFFSVDGLVAFPHAVGQVLGNASPLLASVIKAPATAYTYNPKEDSTEGLEDVFATGAQLTLVSAFQARNSARFTVLGSSAALEDKWFDASVSLPGSTSGKTGQKTANKAFAHALSAWTFKELGVLRVNSVTHRLAEDTRAGITNSTAVSAAPGDVNPEIYRIKNRVHYAVSLSEYSGTHWIPFTPPAGDAVQLEFSMLSPFHRLDLTPSPDTTNPQDNATLYTAEFVLPDQHGIFNFFLEYRRPFYTNVEEKRTVSVRHFAHDEWPRSFVISAAFPWIGGIWVTVLGWLGFVGLWVYSKPGGARRELKVGGVGGKK